MKKKEEMFLLRHIINAKEIRQRELAKALNYSLGKVNKQMKVLVEEEYLDEKYQLTKKTKKLCKDSAPKQAVILAAGTGLRMIPINSEVSKALIIVKGEVLIERLIKQLKEAGIHKIQIVVGFKKEEFEYLMDKYQVELVINNEYSTKNNLTSLSLCNDLENSYIIPCDIYCEENPFLAKEIYSWYMVSDSLNSDSTIKLNKQNELLAVTNNTLGNHMIGIAYFTKEIAVIMKEKLHSCSLDSKYDEAYWEDIVLENGKMMLTANCVDHHKYFEINTYEQLRVIDEKSIHLNSGIMETICNTFNINKNEINNIVAIKKGMTNRSFKFCCKNESYIVRVPGEGTEQLINRSEEYDVYNAIHDIHISDEVVYFNPTTGLKITKFIENARNCDSENEEEVKLCMKKLKEFHEMNLKVGHTFDIFGKINFYEELWKGKNSVFKDYNLTKDKINELKEIISSYPTKWTLCHIDSVPDNFIFSEANIKLIDWEYAGMQDAYVDIAMFAIYALYDKKEVDKLIDAYFDGNCTRKIRIKIYAYIAICGLLWSNWCEYKRFLGVEFGEYALRQYRYAKDYYSIVKAEIKRETI